jgi:FeS assembly SUF system protein
MTVIRNEGTAGLDERVIEVLKTCFDPEIPVNIYELGLVYNIEIDPADVVTIKMTLTSPMCPVAETLPPTVEAKVRNVAGVNDARVEVTWEPPWGPDRMSDAAKLMLNIT